MSLQAAALAAAQRGWAVIPIEPHGKIPAVAWKKYQCEQAAPWQILKWWRANPRYNLGIVTGLVSGVSVVDYDPRHDATGETLAWLTARLPEPNVRTGGGGFHWYVKAASASVPRLMPGLDWKSNGGYIILPPSVHPNGNAYLSLRTDVSPLAGEVGELVKRGRERVAGANRKQTEGTQNPQDGGLSLDDVLSVLKGVKRTQQGWLARCAAHDDQSPSLSVGQGHDGRLLVRCFSGCSFVSVMAAIRQRHSRNLVAVAAALNLRYGGGRNA